MKIRAISVELILCVSKTVNDPKNSPPKVFRIMTQTAKILLNTEGACTNLITLTAEILWNLGLVCTYIMTVINLTSI